MPASRGKRRARKASYIAFGLVALAAVSCSATEVRAGSQGQVLRPLRSKQELEYEEQKPAQVIDTRAEGPF